ncbi:MAG TPA: aminotransferase class V-fold PLP-dependent enzyme [Roseiflexaceae bacterium]|nr:aminotransferase class V-fold PLP-dependent enzyme [Roseiflexaceae bacterium]
MTTYEDLGVRPVINAAATLTRLGGARMPAPVLQAMVDAAGAFVDLDALQERVGARIATLTHNPACYVSSGAAAGLVLAVAACIAGDDPEVVASFPYPEGRRREVVVHCCQRNGFDYAIRQTGARLVEIGTASGAAPEELEAALTERTACVVYFAGAHFARGALPLERVVQAAHARGVPVIVDAAAQIPPIANLWRFTGDLGADIAIFSGGKGLRGPQATGLVLGRPDLIAACRRHGNPNHAIGRPMKVGKEELMGVLAAVEWSLAQDEAALLERYEAMVRFWLEGLRGLPGVRAERGYPSEAGQPHARAIVRLDPACGLTRDALVDALLRADPPVAVGVMGSDAIALNPQTVEPGEERLVLHALRQALAMENGGSQGGLALPDSAGQAPGGYQRGGLGNSCRAAGNG